MPTPKVKFNWSILDRESIVSFMLALAPEVVNTELSVAAFHKKVTNHLKKLGKIM